LVDDEIKRFCIGKRAVLMSILKNGGASTLDVVARIRCRTTQRQAGHADACRAGVRRRARVAIVA
jgi:hypothetical protein